MTYQIEFSGDAERQLSRLTTRDRSIILETIEQQLTHEPTVPTQHRKLLARIRWRIGSFEWENIEYSTTSQVTKTSSRSWQLA